MGRLGRLKKRWGSGGAEDEMGGVGRPRKRWEEWEDRGRDGRSGKRW